MEYLYYQQKMEIVRMKIDKNKLDYANEHPKTKKLSKDKQEKLLAYKGNGKVGDTFMKFYNYFRSIGALPESAFNAAQDKLDEIPLKTIGDER